MTPELITAVAIRPHDSARGVVVTRIHVVDGWYQRDVMCGRDVRLAKRLCDSHGADWRVHPECAELVQSALGGVMA